VDGLAVAIVVASSWGCSHLADAPLVPLTVAEDPRLPSAEITVAGKSRSVHLRAYGNPDAPVLMVAPGSLSDIRAYLPFRSLADEYHVVLWDMRGCGLSERVPADELSIRLMAEEMHQVKLLLSPDEPVTVVGHSWSASFAAIYLARYPDDVEQAVLIEPPGLKSEYMTGLNQVLNLTSVGYCDMNWFQSTVSPGDHARLDFSMLAMLESGVRDFFVDAANKPPWPVWRVGGLALLVWENEVLGAGGRWDFDHSAGLENYTKTVLLVGSSHSPIGYEFQRNYNAKAFHAVELLLIENSGHRIITEQWDALEARLRDYLLQYDGGAG
jgi:proline iminopeptidase